ncbi:MAG: hypothetical protein ACKVKL_12245 [Pseudomonadales bacterium]|tara:strand:+ start:670 stop:831 length:162 start_codon:yes stop_codon:yes gene_type:complete
MIQTVVVKKTRVFVTGAMVVVAIARSQQDTLVSGLAEGPRKANGSQPGGKPGG